MINFFHFGCYDTYCNPEGSYIGLIVEVANPNSLGDRTSISQNLIVSKQALVNPRSCVCHPDVIICAKPKYLCIQS